MQLLTPVQAFSPFENRMLAQFPALTVNSLSSGRFMQNFERFFADQFPGRNMFMAVKTRVERALGKQESNGIYFGKDGFLLAKYLGPEAALRHNLEKLNGLVQRLPSSLRLYFLLAPTSAAVHADKLPPRAPNLDQALIYQQIEQGLADHVAFPDLLKHLQAHAEEYIYYKTDHHWTSLGAYYAYQMVMDWKGETAYGMDDFVHEQVTEDFYGSYYYRVLDQRLEPDSITLWHPRFPVAYALAFPYEDYQLEGLYDRGKLVGNDKYAVWLGGNHSLAILTTQVQNGKELLLLKDSYANCLIPFLANHYETIHIVDLRHFGGDIVQYASQHSISDVMFVYGLASFTTDPSLIR